LRNRHGPAPVTTVPSWHSITIRAGPASL
jgi:hypothetical protein